MTYCTPPGVPHILNPSKLTSGVYIQQGKPSILTCSAAAVGLTDEHKSITDLTLSRYKVADRRKIRIFAHYRIEKTYYKKDVCDVKFIMHVINYLLTSFIRLKSYYVSHVQKTIRKISLIYTFKSPMTNFKTICQSKMNQPFHRFGAV